MKENQQGEEMVGSWKRIDSEVVYENAWIRVAHENVITPGKTQGVYGLVHFKNHAVGIIPIDEDGNTWLVRQSRYALNSYTWEIPEGGAPEGEDILLAAKRELEEECGLCARNWQHLRSVHQSNSVSDEVGDVFVARDIYCGKQALEDTEDIEVRKLPLMEAINMVLNNEITDSLSVAGLLHLAVAMNG